MNNRKLNMLIRFTLEIFLVVLAVNGINSRSTVARSAPAPRQERPGERPGAGVDVARVTLSATSQGARIRVRGQDLPLNDPACLRKLTAQKPDQLIVELTGTSQWKDLFNFALQHDLPVSIEVAK